MTTLRISHAPRRPRRIRRTVLIALAVVPVVTGATLLTAQAITAISGYQPIDFTSWLMALVCVAGLISSLATPGHKRRAPRSHILSRRFR